MSLTTSAPKVGMPTLANGTRWADPAQNYTWPNDWLESLRSDSDQFLKSFGRGITQKLFDIQDAACAYCGTQSNMNRRGQYQRSGSDATLDHILAKSNGGKNRADNFLMCCSECNREKRSIKLDVFWPVKYARLNAHQQQRVRDVKQRLDTYFVALAKQLDASKPLNAYHGFQLPAARPAPTLSQSPPSHNGVTTMLATTSMTTSQATSAAPAAEKISVLLHYQQNLLIIDQARDAKKIWFNSGGGIKPEQNRANMLGYIEMATKGCTIQDLYALLSKNMPNEIAGWQKSKGFTDFYYQCKHQQRSPNKYQLAWWAAVMEIDVRDFWLKSMAQANAVAKAQVAPVPTPAPKPAAPTLQAKAAEPVLPEKAKASALDKIQSGLIQMMDEQLKGLPEAEEAVALVKMLRDLKVEPISVVKAALNKLPEEQRKQHLKAISGILLS